MPQLETLSIPDAADLLKCSAWTIRQLIHKKELPATRIGRSYVIFRTDALQLLRDRIDAEQADAVRVTAVDHAYRDLVA